MNKFYLLILALSGCSVMTQPTGYFEKKECSTKEIFLHKGYCYGGYNDTKVSDSNKYIITFEGNENTSLQRATDLAILRCSDIALNKNKEYMKIDFIKRDIVSSVSSNGKKVYSSDKPVVSLSCYISDVKRNDYASSREFYSRLSEKYLRKEN